MGKNELLVGKALARPARQGAAQREVRRPARPDGAFLGFDARPVATKSVLAYSLSRLGVDYIDIYRPARLDPGGADRGHDRRHRRHGEGGLRPLHQPRPRSARRRSARAAKVHPIVDLQIEYALVSRGPEATIFPALAELGIAVDRLRRAVARPARRQQAGRRGRHAPHLPRFTGENGREEPGARRRARSPRRRQGRDLGAARDRLGPREGRGAERHGDPDDGRAHPAAARPMPSPVSTSR